MVYTINLRISVLGKATTSKLSPNPLFNKSEKKNNPPKKSGHKRPRIDSDSSDQSVLKFGPQKRRKKVKPIVDSDSEDRSTDDIDSVSLVDTPKKKGLVKRAGPEIWDAKNLICHHGIQKVMIKKPNLTYLINVHEIS